MSALTRLQTSILQQSLTEERVATKLVDRAREVGCSAGSPGRDGAPRQLSPKTPLSMAERDHLDAKAAAATDASLAWKETLLAVERARLGCDPQAAKSGSEAEASARSAFVRERVNFAGLVRKLDAGGEGLAPREVGRHLEIASSLLAAPLERPISYQALQARLTASIGVRPAHGAVEARTRSQRPD